MVLNAPSTKAAIALLECEFAAQGQARLGRVQSDLD